MRVLVVLAHPQKTSFAAAIADTVVGTLAASGHQAELLDLYESDFDPRLSRAERDGYFGGNYDHGAVAEDVARLAAAEALILVFPQWWFNLPAILKGYIDRVFVPGVAFDNAADGGRIVPGLDHLCHVWAITTTGSPWWVARLYMGDPVRRILKRGVVAFCAPKADFRMLSLHDMDHSTPKARAAFLDKVRKAVSKI